MFTKVFKGFFLKGFIDWISQWLTIEIWSTIIDDWIAFFFVVVEMATFGVRISSNPVGHRSDSVAFWIQRALQRPSSSDSIDVWRNNRATMASLRASHYSDFCFTKKNQKKNNENLHFCVRRLRFVTVLLCFLFWKKKTVAVDWFSMTSRRALPVLPLRAANSVA